MLRSGALNRIIVMLDSPLDLTVTNTCAAMRSLCVGHQETQDTLREAGVLPKLVELLARAGLGASTKRNPVVAEYACLALYVPIRLCVWLRSSSHAHHCVTFVVILYLSRTPLIALSTH